MVEYNASIWKGEIKMLQKILKNKLYLSIAIAVIAVVIAAIVLTCVLTCGGQSEGKQSDKNDAPSGTGEQKPIFEFEVTLDEENGLYPVTYISASDFYEMIENDSHYTDTIILEEQFKNSGASVHYVIYVNVSGTDFVSFRSGTYLEKGANIYDINYTNCEIHEYDIDSDGEDELIFYTCEVLEDTSKQVCTYYIIGSGEDDIRWCRYNRAWAVGTEKPEGSKAEIVVNEENAFLISLMIAGVDHEVYGRLACDNSGDTPYYYIDAGEYTDMLQRFDQQ